MLIPVPARVSLKREKINKVIKKRKKKKMKEKC
jgi:hypothetical protein